MSLPGHPGPGSRACSVDEPPPAFWALARLGVQEATVLPEGRRPPVTRPRGRPHRCRGDVKQDRGDHLNGAGSCRRPGA